MCPGGQKRANGGVLYAKFCLLQACFCSLWRSSSAAACRRPRLLPNERAILGWAGGRRCPCGLKPVALRLKLTAIKPRNLPLWPKPPVALCPNPRYIIANRPCHAHACIGTRIVVICHGSELRFAPIYNLWYSAQTFAQTFRRASLADTNLQPAVTAHP